MMQVPHPASPQWPMRSHSAGRATICSCTDTCVMRCPITRFDGLHADLPGLKGSTACMCGYVKSCTVRSVDVYQEEEAVRPCTPPFRPPKVYFAQKQKILRLPHSRDHRSEHEPRGRRAQWLGARRVWPGSNGVCRVFASGCTRSVCRGGLYVVEIAA